MDSLIYILLVFLAGAVPLMEYMLAIPLGIIAGAPTIPVIIAGFLGNWITVVLLIKFVDFVWEYLRKRRERKQQDTVFKESDNDDEHEKEDALPDGTKQHPAYTTKSKRAKRAKKLWDKYGVPGLALLGTGFISSHVTALMACLFGGNRVYLTVWMTISLAVWSVLLGVAVHFGMDVFFR
jgi:cbb3-type cytochrome oxidase subunit 3